MLRRKGQRCLKALYVTLAFGLMLIAGSFLTLRVTLKQPTVQSFLSRLINEQFSFMVDCEDISFQWHGFYPGLALKNVHIQARDEQPGIHFSFVSGYIDIFSFFLPERPLIKTLTMVGTALAFETNDYLNYHMVSFPDHVISLQSQTTQWIQKLEVLDSNISVVHPTQSYYFTQTDLVIAPNSKKRILGHATYQDDSDQPCFIHFNHQVDETEQHNWLLSFYGNLAHFNKIVSHQWLINRSEALPLDAHGYFNAQILVQQTQDKTDVTFHTDIKSLEATLGDTRLTADRLDVTLVAEKTEQQWQLSSKNIHYDNASFNDGILLQKETPKFTVRRNQSNQGVTWQLQSQYVPAVIINEIKNIKQQLQPNEPVLLPQVMMSQGDFDYLELHVHQNDAGKKQLTALKSLFNNVALSYGNTDLDGLSGAVYYEQGAGKLQLNSQDVIFVQPHWFEKPLAVDSINGLVFFNQIDNDIILSSDRTNIAIDDARITNAFSITLPQFELCQTTGNRSVSPIVNWMSHIESLSLANVKRHLPEKQMKPALYDWLNNSLLKGDVEQGLIAFRGPLAAFPFDQAEGIFLADLNLKDVGLKFSPNWPALEQATMRLQFENRAMTATAKGAQLLGVGVEQVQAQIQNVAGKPAVLETQVVTKNTTVNQGVHILNQSPLREKLVPSLQALQMQGDIDLDLSLTIPLAKTKPLDILVDGKIHTDNAQLRLLDGKLQVTTISGDVAFTQESVSSENLSGKVGEQWSNFQLKTHGDHTQLHAEGEIDFSYLIPGQPLFQQAIKGHSAYHAAFDLVGPPKQQHGDFVITTDLEGTEIQLLSPISKDAQSQLPLTIKGEITAEQVHTYRLQFPQKSLGLQFQQTSESSSTLLAGYLHFDGLDSHTFEQGVFAISGEFEALNAPKTIDFLKQHFAENKNQTKIVPRVDCLIGEIQGLGQPLKNVKVEAYYDDNLENMLYSLRSDIVRGYFSVPYHDHQRVLVVDLDYVNIPNNFFDSEHKNAWLSDTTENQSWMQYPLDLHIEQLVVNNKQITNIQAQLEPINYGHHIKRLNAYLGDAHLESTGYWHYLSGSSQVDITGQVKTKNISTMMNALGLQGTLKEAKGQADFALSWEGMPYQLDTKTLSGEVNFDFKDGLIQGVNPGFGRVLSLLNLDNIRRRLNLDFSDVTKQGMTFDSLKGKMHLLEGVIHTDKVILESPSVKIETTFRTSLTDQFLNGHMDVMPNLTGSLPIAAAIAAGNPAVGAAVWVMDKLFGKKIQEINRIEYRLSGTWEAPHIQEMSTKTTRRDIGKR